MRFLASLSLIAVFLAGLAGAAKAQGLMCDTRVKVVALLTEKYGETQRGAGVAGRRQVLEIWASEETGTFSVIASYPDGKSCLIAGGKHWQNFEPLPTGEPM